jgi:hypothetical protein
MMMSMRMTTAQVKRAFKIFVCFLKEVIEKKVKK